jgi:hypothetical protein
MENVEFTLKGTDRSRGPHELQKSPDQWMEVRLFAWAGNLGWAPTVLLNVVSALGFDANAGRS